MVRLYFQNKLQLLLTERKGVLAVSDYQSVKGVKEATTKVSEKMQYKNQWRMLGSK